MRWNKVVALLKIWFIFQFCVELLHLCALKFYIFVMYCKRVRFCWVINFSRLLQHVFKKPCHDAFKRLFVGDIISHNKIVSYARHKSNKTLSIKTWLACMPRTMLQKLSKCEVKAWLSWNLIILLPLRFYVKSNNGDFKWFKNVIFGNFRGAELWILVNVGLESYSKPKIKIQNL